MVVNKGEDIGMTLQLIKSDGTSVEEDATVSYSIYDATGTVEVVSSQTTTYNSTTKSFMDTLDPDTSWTTQEVGTYLVVWSVSDTDDDFNDTYTEELQINIDKTLIDRILGLVHQNIIIDQTQFDPQYNLVGARVRIFEDSTMASVLATYRIAVTATGSGQFSHWEQVEE
jgi:hypothetical protein